LVPEGVVPELPPCVPWAGADFLSFEDAPSSVIAMPDLLFVEDGAALDLLGAVAAVSFLGALVVSCFAVLALPDCCALTANAASIKLSVRSFFIVFFMFAIALTKVVPIRIRSKSRPVQAGLRLCRIKINGSFR
jgi:hypothetical protein